MHHDKSVFPETHGAGVPQSDVAEDNAAAAGQSSPTSSVKKDDNARPREIGGRNGPEPTRFGDWEKNGRCIDF